MIEHLTGIVFSRLPGSLIIEVNGVGYGVEMPLSALCEAPPPGQSISVWIDTYVREDALRLYGFMTFEDRQAFMMLRGVSGIGPRIALAILSTLDARTLRQTVLQNKIGLLESVPGIGRRTAEKLILELKPKMEKLSFAAPTITAINYGSSNQPRANGAMSAIDGLNELENEANQLEAVVSDVRSALTNLGYKDKEINPILAGIIRNTDSNLKKEFQIILKSALKSLRDGMSIGN
jgi:Holliday junction DNA helicase RuvA